MRYERPVDFKRLPHFDDILEAGRAEAEMCAFAQKVSYAVATNLLLHKVSAGLEN